jgi:hypothetical protein
MPVPMSGCVCSVKMIENRYHSHVFNLSPTNIVLSSSSNIYHFDIFVLFKIKFIIIIYFNYIMIYYVV